MSDLSIHANIDPESLLELEQDINETKILIAEARIAFADNPQLLEIIDRQELKVLVTEHLYQTMMLNKAVTDEATFDM